MSVEGKQQQRRMEAEGAGRKDIGWHCDCQRAVYESSAAVARCLSNGNRDEIDVRKLSHHYPDPRWRTRQRVGRHMGIADTITKIAASS